MNQKRRKKNGWKKQSQKYDENNKEKVLRVEKGMKGGPKEWGVVPKQKHKKGSA